MVGGGAGRENGFMPCESFRAKASLGVLRSALCRQGVAEKRPSGRSGRSSESRNCTKVANFPSPGLWGINWGEKSVKKSEKCEK